MNERHGVVVLCRGIYTFTAAYGSSFGPIGWVLPSEVFPLSMRSQGVALSTASNWSNNCTFVASLQFRLNLTCSLHSLSHRPHHSTNSYTPTQPKHNLDLTVPIGLLTPVLITYSPSATFVIFATSCFVAYLWSTYVVPETANVSLEEMDEVFKSEVGREDREVKGQVGVVPVPGFVPLRWTCVLTSLMFADRN